jgi:hypothetical protein
MSRNLAATSALGAALALAITLTTAVGPAFAETPKIDVVPSNPIVNRPIGPLPEPKPESSTVTFVPDVRVNYIGKSAGSGGKVTYRFRIQNIGIGTAVNVGLDTRLFQHSNVGNVASMQYGPGGSIASLDQDEAKEFTMTCTPNAGYHCDGARVDAIVADDLDPTNNSAVAH